MKKFVYEYATKVYFGDGAAWEVFGADTAEAGIEALADFIRE